MAPQTPALAHGALARGIGGMDTRRSFELAVENMTCGKCVGRVERALKTVQGVVAVNVELSSGRVQVEGAGLSDVSALITGLSKPALMKQCVGVYQCADVRA